MTPDQMSEMMKLSQKRAEMYLHLAKSMVVNDFGPSTENTQIGVTVALAAAMMQHEGAQIIAEAYRSDDV